MSGRHGREAYYIAGEGMRGLGTHGEMKHWVPSGLKESVEFRFSRFVPSLVGAPNSDDVLAQLAVVAMVQKKGQVDAKMPAGYTYLGQFVDHDMTLDPSELDLATTGVLPLQSLRSPTLDLDSLYGRGPDVQPEFYQDDGVKLLIGRPLPVPGVNPTANGDGYDLPRRGTAADGRRRTAREAKIPDIRNDGRGTGACGLHPFSQQGRRRSHGQGRAQPRPVRARARNRDQALPLDVALTTTCRASAHRRWWTTCTATAAASSRPTRPRRTRRCRWSFPVRRSAWATA